MPAKGESPSSPFYVTVSMKTHQEECRRLHKRGSPVGSAKDKSEDDYPPHVQKDALKVPSMWAKCAKKNQKHDEMSLGFPYSEEKLIK